MLVMDRFQPVVVDMSGSEIEHGVQEVLRLVAELGIEREEWVRVLGSALVAAAVAPFWVEGETAGDAHNRMSATDAELATVVDALAPMLYSRELGARTAAAALAEIESLLGN